MPNVDAPLVMVLWIDSATQTGWQDVQTAKELRELRCLSVGWLMHESKEGLILVPHAAMNSDLDFDSVCGHMTIPRVAIQRVETIQRANSRA